MSTKGAAEHDARVTCKKCERAYGEPIERTRCKACDELFCSNCLSDELEFSGSKCCRKCGAALCRAHIVQVFCDCKFTPYNWHSMCDHGDVYCQACVFDSALNKSTLVPFECVDVELRSLREKIRSLEFKMGVMESDRRIHMQVYHPDEADGSKKRKN